MDGASVITSPAGNLEVVISFDTTGSMYSWLDELQGRVQDLIQRLQADIPGIRIAVFAHGDYCDLAMYGYVTKWINLSSDVVQLCNFVKNVQRTGGGDAPECYELVLRQVRTELSWTPGSRRVLVLIGDDVPHEPDDACNKEHIDWRAEVKALALGSVTIYGVQCGANPINGMFYEAISMATGGKHLQLAQFDSLFHTLIAVCYKEVSDFTRLENYEAEMRAKTVNGGIAPDIDAILAKFKCNGTSSPYPTAPLKPLKPFTAAKKANPVSSVGPTSSRHVTPFVKGPVNKTGTSKAKNTKTTPKTKGSRFDKFSEKNLPLLKRENVPENNFNLRSLRWSQWIMVMTNDLEHTKTNPEMWGKRVFHTGYKLKRLPVPKSFSASDRKSNALFEFAVQAKDSSKKRFVVFSTFSSRCFDIEKLNWEMRLLRYVNRQQADHVLTSGGRIFLRYCLVTSKDSMKAAQKSIRRYDYAWRQVRKIRHYPRDLVKGDFVFSKAHM